jgi:hypothetical protein
MRRITSVPECLTRRSFCASAIGLLATGTTALAQQPRKQLVEPLYREAKAKVDQTAPVSAHPLDRALARAHDGLQNIRQNVRDYSATLVKQERIGDTVLEPEYMFAKFRNERVVNGRVEIPFAVYLYFLKPAEIKGREVIYVRGQNDDKLIAHERRDSFKGKFGSVWLRPDGMLAMQGNRYPITEIGIETLVLRLIEKGNRDKRNGEPSECLVDFFEGAAINQRKCTMLQVKHPVPRDYYDFHVAQIFIDEELNVPIRYAAFSWPSRPGGNPELIEAYTYLNLELNVGFTDKDFDPTNPDYRF